MKVKYRTLKHINYNGEHQQIDKWHYIIKDNKIIKMIPEIVVTGFFILFI